MKTATCGMKNTTDWVSGRSDIAEKQTTKEAYKPKQSKMKEKTF